MGMDIKECNNGSISKEGNGHSVGSALWSLGFQIQLRFSCGMLVLTCFLLNVICLGGKL